MIRALHAAGYRAFPALDHDALGGPGRGRPATLGDRPVALEKVGGEARIAGGGNFEASDDSDIPS